MTTARRDRGMTLTELLITVTVLGIIMGVLSSATVLFLRNQNSAVQRVDETRGLQQLVNYLPGDVASAQVIKVDGDEDGCGSGGTPFLHLSWEEEFGDTITLDRVSYRSFTGEVNRLTRFHCRGDATSPTSQVDVASNFSLLQVFSASFIDGRVRVTLNYPETGDAPATRRTITAQSRNMSPQDLEG